MPLQSLLRRTLRNCTRGVLRREREYLCRRFLFETVVGFISDCRIEGDYLEFGCAEGGSLIDMFDTIRPYPRLRDMHFYIFDSFQGLPEPDGLDGGEGRRWARGEFACTASEFRRNVSRGGVDLNRVTMTPGWYNEALTVELKDQIPLKKAAIIFIDCDLYESTVPILDFITCYVQSGTVVIFDDWFSYNGRLDLGEARAFKEWLAKNPQIEAVDYHKAGRTMTSFILQPHPQRASTALQSPPSPRR